MITEDEIRKLAQSIWEAERCPEGRNWDHYFRAKRMLEEKERIAFNMERLAWLMERDKRQAPYMESSTL